MPKDGQRTVRSICLRIAEFMQLSTCFYFTRCALNLLCLDLRVTFFLLYLVRYILTSRMQRTHAALGRF